MPSEQRADGRDRSREPIVKIAVAENPATAEFVQQVLTTAGIRCFAKNTDPLGVMYGSAWTSPFSVNIYVLSGDELSSQCVLAKHGLDASAPIALPTARRYRRRR